jgi:hypothetical protein
VHAAASVNVEGAARTSRLHIRRPHLGGAFATMPRSRNHTTTTSAPTATTPRANGDDDAQWVPPPLNTKTCQLSMCSPSRSSVLTGARPDSTGVYDLVSHWRDRLGPGAVSLGAAFKALGYQSRAVGKVRRGRAKAAAPSLLQDR